MIPPSAGYGGFRGTRVIGDQSRLAPLHRVGCYALAAA
jgi:hypothetical protein